MSIYPRSITELFAIEVPIIQAPMLGIVTAEMIIRVAEAGGLGSLPPPIWARKRLRSLRRTTTACGHVAVDPQPRTPAHGVKPCPTMFWWHLGEALAISARP
jgi:NAD(P)H-dependent flavin oxidoreductase YrpB (nitropropane dioxygenase family)